MWGRVETFCQDERCRFNGHGLGEVWTLGMSDTLIYLFIKIGRSGHISCGGSSGQRRCDRGALFGVGHRVTSLLTVWEDGRSLWFSEGRPMWKCPKCAFYCFASRNHHSRSIQIWYKRLKFSSRLLATDNTKVHAALILIVNLRYLNVVQNGPEAILPLMQH